MLFESFAQLKHLISINLNGNDIDDTCLSSLGMLIQQQKMLNCVKIGGSRYRSKITDAGVKVLASYIIGNKSLRILFLSEHRSITDRSVPILVDMIEKSNLEIISIYATSIINMKAFVLPFIRNRLRNNNLSSIDFPMR